MRELHAPLRLSRSRYIDVTNALAFALRELMHPLVRQAEQAGRVSGAHLQSSAARAPNRSPRGRGRLAIFLFSSLPKGGVGPDRTSRLGRQFHLINKRRRTGIIDEELERFGDPSPCLLDGSSLRMATSHTAYGRDPPARRVAHVRHSVSLHSFINHPLPRHGSRSRSMRRSSPRPPRIPLRRSSVVIGLKGAKGVGSSWPHKFKSGASCGPTETRRPGVSCARMRAMPNRKPTITELFEDGRAIDEALLEAARDARRLHKALGNPMATWKDGRVVWVQPEDIEVDAKPDEDPVE